MISVKIGRIKGDKKISIIYEFIFNAKGGRCGEFRYLEKDMENKHINKNYVIFRYRNKNMLKEFIKQSMKHYLQGYIYNGSNNIRE